MALPPPKRRSFRVPLIVVRLITTLGIGAACYAPIYITSHRQRPVDVHVDAASKSAGAAVSAASLADLLSVLAGNSGESVACSTGTDRLQGLAKWDISSGTLAIALTTVGAKGAFGGPLRVSLHIAHAASLGLGGRLRLTSERYKLGKMTGSRQTNLVELGSTSSLIQGEIILKAKEGVRFTLSK